MLFVSSDPRANTGTHTNPHTRTNTQPNTWTLQVMVLLKLQTLVKKMHVEKMHWLSCLHRWCAALAWQQRQ